MTLTQETFDSHYGLAQFLKSNLNTFETWVIIVYDDVYGGSKHTWKGYEDNDHVSFRKGGHNIVVGCIPYGTVAPAPGDTQRALNSALTLAPETYVSRPVGGTPLHAVIMILKQQILTLGISSLAKAK